MMETDRGHRARQINIDVQAGGRRVNGVFPVRLNLLRFEHEHQTVMDGGAFSRRDYSERRRCR